MNTTAVTDLLADLARDIPNLRDAACRSTNVHDVATARDHAAVKRAQAVCANCPAHQPCADWLSSLPPHRLPTGVVAGRFVRPPTPRPLPDPKPKQPTKTDRAAHWLAAYLADGPVISTQVRADATAAGIDIHNLARARRHLGVQLERLDGQRGGYRTWTLPTNHRKATPMPDERPDGTPTPADLARARMAIIGWATNDRPLVDAALAEANEEHRPLSFVVALCDTAARALHLFDNQASVDWMRASIMRLREKENPK